MPKNAIKREGRVNFWKNIDYKKPETRPEPVMSNPNPTQTRRNISKPDPNPKKISKPEPDPNPTFGNPTHHYIPAELNYFKKRGLLVIKDQDILNIDNQYIL